MGFRDREKRRLVPLKPELFSAEACEPGCYGKNRQDFCLRDDRASENLHASIRDVAVDYFRERDILWHDGIGGGPSNHLCCSQSFCVNFWFPFREAPGPLAAVLRGLGVRCSGGTAVRAGPDWARRKARLHGLRVDW